VQGFPTIKFLCVVGGKIKAAEYRGGRTAKGIVEFAMDKVVAWRGARALQLLARWLRCGAMWPGCSMWHAAARTDLAACLPHGGARARRPVPLPTSSWGRSHRRAAAAPAAAALAAAAVAAAAAAAVLAKQVRARVPRRRVRCTPQAAGHPATHGLCAPPHNMSHTRFVPHTHTHTRVPCAGGEDFYKNTDVVTLTDASFDEEVVQSEELWYVEVSACVRGCVPRSCQARASSVRLGGSRNQRACGRAAVQRGRRCVAKHAASAAALAARG
jgi:hypothetical protein